MFYRAATLACILLIPSLLMADVTLTYKTENKLSPSLPAAFAQTLGASHILSAPSGRKIAVRGGKFYANTSLTDIIADLPNDKLTLIDPAHQHYVTIPGNQYAEQLAGTMPKLPASMQSLLASIKLKVDSRVTGRTAEIQGIQAEEHEIVLALGIPMGQGAGAPLSPVMKIVLQLWRAKPEEIARNPALQEFVASGFLSLGGTNPAEAIQKMLSQFPGISDSLAAFSKEAIDPHSVTLRMHAEVSMPILAMMMPRAAAAPGASPAPAPDPNAPIMEINEELTSISTAPIPDSTFAVPDGYTQLPLAAFMSGMMPKPPAPAVKPAPAPAPVGK
jgi:hypothetical protein